MASVSCRQCGSANPPEARFCANCGSILVNTGPAAAIPAVASEYAGFWIRFAAFLIDFVIIIVISFFLHIIHFGFAILFFPTFVGWLYYWLFTGLRGQTPGKIAVGIRVINARGAPPGLGIAALREIPGKILSSFVFCLGYFWIGWDGKKQGWHDKIAGTYVVRVSSRQ
jgi:uncharacterized RDD family membrane protein YckC